VQLIENTENNSYLITTINRNKAIINKQEFMQSCIVSNNSILTDIELTKVEDLTSKHIQHLLSSHPELIILGSGVDHVFPNVELLNPIAKANIGFEVMNNKSAARTYNVLVAEERKVACLLII